MRVQHTILLVICMCLLYTAPVLFARADDFIENTGMEHSDSFMSPYSTQDYKKILSSPSGVLYAHIVLLFNNNPHFLNVIKDEDFSGNDVKTHDDIYREYSLGILDDEIRAVAQMMLQLYEKPLTIKKEQVNTIERVLEKHDVIAKFVLRDGAYDLDYCIYGKRRVIQTEHPFLVTKEKIYNIQPIIHYDEFYSSNSTFYHDLIYIDINEVKNDSDILKKILAGKEIPEEYYVGARITNDMKVCAKKAFQSGDDEVEEAIRRIFVIHEMTHKLINNRFNYYNRIVEEELAIASTLYENPYLALSVVYSYLNYHYVHSPHRIAALKFLRFVADDMGETVYLYSPSRIRSLSEDQLRQIAYRYFYTKMDLVNNGKKNHAAMRLDVKRKNYDSAGEKRE